jgi:hypothetical protein
VVREGTHMRAVPAVVLTFFFTITTQRATSEHAHREIRVFGQQADAWRYWHTQDVVL